MLRAVFVRTLKAGVTYEQFAAAWLPVGIDGDYPAKTRVSRNLSDDRQVITIVELDIQAGEFKAALASLTRLDARDRLEEIVASTQLEGAYEDVLDEATLRGIDVSDVIAGYWRHYLLNRVPPTGKDRRYRVDDDFWAWEFVEDVARRGASESIGLLVKLAEAAPDDGALAYLGAGPLEGLIQDRGEQVFDAIEAAARQHPRLMAALAGVICGDDEEQHHIEGPSRRLRRRSRGRRPLLRLPVGTPERDDRPGHRRPCDTTMVRADAALNARSLASRSARCRRQSGRADRWDAAAGTSAADGYLVATHALTDSTDAERSGVRLELA